jgi:AcrR family transcriptional regulator
MPAAGAAPSEARDQMRERIVDAASRLLAQGGREAVSTRAVCLAAAIQPPTIYRIFGDMHGLLDAVAARSFAEYLQEEAVRPRTDDPLDDLRAGWDTHVGFGLSHPRTYSLMYGDPRPGVVSRAAEDAFSVLSVLVGRLAAAGRLRVKEEQASVLLTMAGTGSTLTLIGMAEEQRAVSASHQAREAVISAITTEAPVTSEPGLVGAGLAFRAHLHEAHSLSDAEELLLREWIERVVAEQPEGAP